MKKVILAVLLLLATPVYAMNHKKHNKIVQKADYVQSKPVPDPTLPQVSSSPLKLGAFNADIGEIKVYFIPWNGQYVCAPGKTTLIYWESYGISTASIANGSQDNVIKNLKICPNTVLAWGHEMNLSESPWGGNPSIFIQAWRRIHDLIGNKVKYAWVINNSDVPNRVGNHPADYYPGDAYVDYVGIDGFNWGKTSFLESIAPNFEVAKSFKKPIWITSFGTATNQAAWITDAIKQAKSNGIEALIYFNYSDEGGLDFSLTSQGKAAFML